VYVCARARETGAFVSICELANGVKGVAACAYLKAADLEGHVCVRAAA
jgi:hypothetical protein